MSPLVRDLTVAKEIAREAEHHLPGAQVMPTSA
jgi:hypothetical protein